MIKTLSFATGNSKLKNDTIIFSLPAGHSCPFAKNCRSSSDRVTGKITDGPHTEFRCYAATAECLFGNIRESRWNNFELLKTAKTIIGMANLIETPLIVKKNIKLIRIHQSGDFFNQTYFDAWLMVAKCHPEWVFYGYTKALPFWVKRLGEIPGNFRLVASRGGTHDHLIEEHGLRSARVVYSEYAARKLRLPIDHDDTHAWKGTGDFAILLHGTQPKGSLAGKAWQRIKGIQGGYKADYFAYKSKQGKSKRAILAPVVSVKSVAAARTPVYA
jgi:hypothetical protein